MVFGPVVGLATSDDGDIDQLGHGGELAQQIGSGIARQIGIEQQRSGRADAERVAVGRGLGELLQAERAAGAGLVLDHDLATETRAELVADDARGAVRGRAGRERNDDLDRLLRRLRERRAARQHERKWQGTPQQHSFLPLLIRRACPRAFSVVLAFLASWIVRQILYGVAGILMSRTP